MLQVGATGINQPNILSSVNGRCLMNDELDRIWKEVIMA
jgi:hypothetical protein